MDEKKKTCYSCAYRGTLPGSAHSKCTFNWGKSDTDPPKGAEVGIRRGWWNFPFNYDPVWMEEECNAHSEESDSEMIKEFNPLERLQSLLG